MTFMAKVLNDLPENVQAVVLRQLEDCVWDAVNHPGSDSYKDTEIIANIKAVVMFAQHLRRHLLNEQAEQS
jgi:hypothetical protein